MNIKKLKNIKQEMVNSPEYLMYSLLWGIMLIGYIRGIINHLPFLNHYTDLIELILIIGPIILSIPRLFKINNTIHGLALYVLFSAIYLVSYLTHPENSIILDKELFRCLITVFPFVIIGCVLDYENCEKHFIYISVACILVSSIYSLFYVQSSLYVGDVDTSDYNMNQAYMLLPHVLLCMYYLTKHFSISLLLVELLGVLMLLSYGTRGPIVCLLSFFTFLVLFLNSNINIKIKILIVLLIGVFIAFLKPIMLFLNYFVGDVLGMSTRIFEKFLEEELIESTGRDSIFNTLINEIKINDSIGGHGIFGSYNFTGGYPHNLFLDFWFSFGVFGGSLLLLFVFILIYKALKRSSFTQKSFILILFCCSIIKLLVSGSFIFDSYFFLLIGYSVQILLTKHKLIS